MDIDWKTEGNVTILTLSGELDTSNLDELKAEMNAQVDEGHIRVCVNLEGVRFINSSHIGNFVAFHKRLAQEDGEMVLSCPSGFLQTTIKTLGLDRVFRVYGSNADAVAHFGGAEAETLESDAPIDPSLLGSAVMRRLTSATGGGRHIA